MAKRHQYVASAKGTRTGQHRKERHKETQYLSRVAKTLVPPKRSERNGTHVDEQQETTKAAKVERVSIEPPRFVILKLRLVGTAPYMQNRFSQKARLKMEAKMTAGHTAKKGAKREPRNFEDDFQQAMHRSVEGWIGVPASGLRNACIDACRMVDFKMTRAKMSIFFEYDGLDKEDKTPLIRLQAGKPEALKMPVPNQTGVVDIRVRPFWEKWALEVTVRFDADQFSPEDVINLVARAGAQVGIGEGRAFSRNSNGMGYGFFKVDGEASVIQA